MADNIRERLADQEHERWSRWMKYLFSLCYAMVDDGALVIPANSVKHWQRQIDTPYAELSEKEKDSDRKEADNTLRIVQDEIDANVAKLANQLKRKEAGEPTTEELIQEKQIGRAHV